MPSSAHVSALSELSLSELRIGELSLDGVTAAFPVALAGLVVWALWLYRVILSRRARPVVNDYRTTTSVVVPSYHEDPDILMRCLDSWLSQGPTEVIIVLDVADTEAQQRILALGDSRVRAVMFKHAGKRSALGVGIRLATSEVLVLVDSDTSWQPGLLDAVQMPFVQPDVGGVSTQQNVFQRESSVWRRIADWLVDLRYYDYVPAMGAAGAVACLSGRTAAYRRAAVLPVLEHLENEFFLGRRCIAGDDGRLTWLVLASGYRTVHQSSARAISMFPASFRAFVKQRIRWSRNSYRCYLTAIAKGWLWSVPFVTKITVLQILLTPVTMGITLAYLLFARIEASWVSVVLAVAWILLGRGVRGWSHLRRHPRDLVLLPLVTLVVIFIALPIKLYAFVTMNKQGWLTRSADQIGGEGQTAASLQGSAGRQVPAAPVHAPAAPALVGAAVHAEHAPVHAEHVPAHAVHGGHTAHGGHAVHGGHPAPGGHPVHGAGHAPERSHTGVRGAAVLPGIVVALLLAQGIGVAHPSTAAAAEAGSGSEQTRAATTPSADPGTGRDADAEADADDAADQDELTAAAGTYPGNPTSESALVADEEERLSQVRTVASMIRWRGLDVSGPYRLSTGSTYTLVLTKRDEQYGIAELLELAPQTFVRDPDGAYLLTENIVVQPGATLDLSAAGALTVRMASDAARFVSIVNMGGELITRGTAKAPVILTSWDRDAGAPDTTTDDGRAYVRSIGGRVDLENTTFSDLGFWSGRTGGVALTGSDLPSAGVLDAFGRELRDAVDASSPAVAAPPTAEQRRAAEDAAAAGGVSAVEPPVDPQPAPAAVGVDGLLPAGVLPVPEQDLEDPSYSYVSAHIEGSTFERNAFGLFVSSANGVDISRSVIEDSLVDGLVMHRFVVNAAVSGTTSQGNAGDGIILARATTGIVLTEVEALANGGSGIVVRGNPLADGPSATGMPVGEYGNNSIANSTANDNARYGIELVGGRNISVSASDADGNDMGIVVRDAAAEVTLVGNRISGSVRHGIALRDGVQDASVSGNVISGGPNGIYLRDSTARVERNTLSGLTVHGVTVVGAAAGTTVTENTLAGRGPSAIDRKRAEGVTVEENDTHGWESTKPFWTVVRNALQPLTVMWILLALLVLGTALKGSRHGRTRRDPYGAQRRLAELVEPPVVYAAPVQERRPSHDDRLALAGVAGPASGPAPLRAEGSATVHP